MRRWHAHHGSTGTGPLYQGRFKSFPIQADGHLLRVCRYVERNALRAELVPRAQQWTYGSLARRTQVQPPGWLLPQRHWPVTVPRDWVQTVNRPQSPSELEALRRSVNRGAPFGQEAWQRRTAIQLKLESSLRDPWRPRRNAGRKEGEGNLTPFLTHSEKKRIMKRLGFYDKDAYC